MRASEHDFGRERAAMVAGQLRGRGIRDERVLAAMGAVPREHFVEAVDRSLAYADEALPIEAGQTISQPFMVARMTELLEVATGRPDPRDRHRIGLPGRRAGASRRPCDLDRAPGHTRPNRPGQARATSASATWSRSGSRMAASAIRPAHRGTGSSSRRPRRPFPNALREQLAEGGHLVIPVGPRDRQILMVVTRHGDEWDGAARRTVRLRPAHRRRRVRGLSAGYTRPAMTHVFVAPHPDDVALSCGGLIASLRELGQNVTILTVYSGDGGTDRLSGYQREALGFGSKAVWPVTEAFNRSDILADWPTAARYRRGPQPRTASRPRRPTRMRPPSASGSARRGTGGRACATSRSPTSR